MLNAQLPFSPTLSLFQTARQAAGLTHAETARLAGVPRSTVERCDLGEIPSLPIARKLATALQADLADLFGVDVEIPAPGPRPAWPPARPSELITAVQAYRAAGDTIGAAELLHVHPTVTRRHLTAAGAESRPRGGSRADGVISLAGFGRKIGASAEQIVAAALQNRVPGAFVERLDCPVIRHRWAVRT